MGPLTTSGPILISDRFFRSLPATPPRSVPDTATKRMSGDRAEEMAQKNLIGGVLLLDLDEDALAGALFGGLDHALEL